MEDIAVDIIKRAQSGDRAAFDNIVSFYRKRVLELCCRYTRNRDESFDVAQDVFCSAYAAIRNFKHESRFSTWLYRITVNHCINALDKLKRRRYFDNASLDEKNEDGRDLTQVSDRAIPADEELEMKEFRESVLEVIMHFPEKEKRLVMMRDIQGLDYGEIAEITGNKIGSVKSKLSRARKRLKKKMENEK